MKQKLKRPILFCLWGFFYVLTAGLGTVTDTEGTRATVMTILSVLFFLPPFLLVAEGWKKQDKKLLRTVRWIAITSLVLTLGFLIGNILSAGSSEAAGTTLYWILNFVSAPMFCSGYYALSLFLWACVLFSTIPAFVQKKR